MKAMIMEEFGGPDVLRLKDVPDPDCGPDDVVIDVRAVSVNRTFDLSIRKNTHPHKVKLPHVLGADPAGVISKIGDNVSGRAIGDRVVVFPLLSGSDGKGPRELLGIHRWGGYAERVVVPAAATHLIPDGLDFPQACVISRHAPIALNLVTDKAKLRAGETVLVMGASGALGSVIIQVAKHLGATVIAGAGSDDRVQAAKNLGADHGINYRSHSLKDEVMKLTGGVGVNVVFENLADPELFPQALAALAREGRMVTAGAHAGPVVPLNVQELYMKQLTIIGSTRVLPSDMDKALEAAASGNVRITIERIMPLAEAPEAHRLLESRAVTGKIILVP